MPVNWIDVSILVILGLTTVRGLIRGLVRSVFDILAFGIAVFLAFYWYNDLSIIISNYLKMPKNVILIISFVGIWIAAYAATTFAGQIIHKLLGKGFFGPLNLLGGALLGAAKGLLMIWLILQMIFTLPLSPELSKPFKTSFTINTLDPIFEVSSKFISGIMPDKVPDFKGKIKENKAPERKGLGI